MPRSCGFGNKLRPINLNTLIELFFPAKHCGGCGLNYFKMASCIWLNWVRHVTSPLPFAMKGSNKGSTFQDFVCVLILYLHGFHRIHMEKERIICHFSALIAELIYL